jgi:NAD(P)-dependent dehydrogenase (short-subunit alcohol dehydrogenase family)
VLLDGRVAIVSGVGPGLGQAVATAFGREGARLVLAARTEAYLAEVAGEVEASGAAGGRPIVVPTDVTDAEACGRLVGVAVAAHGRVDVVVNNAFASFPYHPFERADLDDWRRIYEVNLFGALALTQAALPAMRAAGGGSVVMVGSMASRKPRPGYGGYATSKAALLNATRQLALELGPYGIRVNAVVPGWLWGPPVQQYVEYQSQKRGVPPEEVVGELTAAIPLGFVPSQEDCANAVVFFASDLSRVVTGQALDVNGGEVFA